MMACLWRSSLWTSSTCVLSVGAGRGFVRVKGSVVCRRCRLVFTPFIWRSECHAANATPVSIFLRSPPLLPGLRALHQNAEPFCLWLEPSHDVERRGRTDVLELGYRVMTLSDVAELTCLSWDTVKTI